MTLFLARVFTTGALTLVSNLAFAHGETHGSSVKPAAIKKEQKVWGIAGDAKRVSRIVTVSMSDEMRFTPGLIEVRLGETVKFVHRNDGEMLHEFVIGTRKVLDEHAALMVKFPEMEHDEPYMAHVGAGEVEEMVWTFNRVGEFEFACLIPGHYQAGMVGKIKVVPSNQSRKPHP